MNVGLLGFGTVGSHFYLLAQQQPGVKVKAVLSRRPRPEVSCLVTADFAHILSDPDIDTVVEAMGGLHPAYEYITAAMAAGKHVITANKQVVCTYYNELLALAEKTGVALRCTAAVGGGIPWLTSLRRAARMDKMVSVEGIVNGTTNFMLSAMVRRGASFADALHEAQLLGYAEADPSADVEGYDARRKLVLSANLAFGVSLMEEDIPCVGITNIQPRDVAVVRDKGLTFKLMAYACRQERGISAYVAPVLVQQHTTEANVEDTGNILTLVGEHIGRQSFLGAGAGGWPTASNVMGDCLAVAAGERGYYTRDCTPCFVKNELLDGQWFYRFKGEYYFRQCTAEAAFSAYAVHLMEDPQALMAKVR